jgi:hypothetical protein
VGSPLAFVIIDDEDPATGGQHAAVYLSRVRWRRTDLRSRNGLAPAGLHYPSLSAAKTRANA